MSGTNVNKYIRGIDACANEINCRPEVFAQSFRYLSDIMFESEYVNNNRSQKIMTKLHTTYHVGEDFFDIVDGIRAVDEALLFCGLGRGSRIGHGLALGVDPYTYYCYKGKHWQWKSRGYLIILSGFYAGQMNLAFMLIKV